MKVLVCIALVALVSNGVQSTDHWVTDEFVAKINSKASTWTAKKNFEGYSADELKAMAGLLGTHPDPTFKLPTIYHDVVARGIPETFDSRQVWPQCLHTIQNVRNQGRCGSCWAFAAVETMSDRLCIFTDGKKNFLFSPEELITCCKECGDGCKGGWLLPPFEYWQKNGIPSGGDEGSKRGCRPYTSQSSGVTGTCSQECISDYGKQWKDDIRHGIAAFHVTNTVEQIQQEIVKNGPVEASFQVYDDFYSYGSGVYQYTYGNFVGYHAIKIIGWGTDNGTPYWLIVNSWGSEFGEQGLFKILRGSNHCQIESEITAGIPDTSAQYD